MNEEIKEILDDLGNKDNYIEEFGYQYKRISIYDSFQLLDYITKLQQENEKLKYNGRGQVNDYFKDKYADEVLKNAELKKENDKIKRSLFCGEDKFIDNYIKHLEEEKECYKSRCKKAIEYIKEHWVIDEPIKFKNDLLNILNGSDDK